MIDLPEVDRLVQQAFRLNATGAREQAEALLKEALARDPDDPMAQTRMAEIETDRKQHEAATVRLRAVLRRHRHFAPAWAALAHASWIAGKPADGLRHARRAVSISPYNPHFRLVLGQFCIWLYRHEEVPSLLAPLLADDQPDPMVRARALSLTGEMLMASGAFAAADPWFEAALATVPEMVNTRVIQGMNRLRLGDFATGLPAYEARTQVSFFHPSGLPRRPAPAWTGEALAGRTILLEDDQGFGDSIHFFRYVWKLRDAGASRIVLKTFPPLVSLLQAAAPFVEVIATIPDGFVPDFHCFTASLPFAFGTRLETVPNDVSYLGPPAGLPDPRSAGRGRLRVGLVWSGDRRHPRDHRRSIPAARFLRLADRDDCDFVSLQADIRPADLPALLARPAILRAGERVRDYSDTAAVVEQLDLVIAVDTSVGHLAGAMGKPVWLVLPIAPDWRWLAGRDDSPWYPTMRLFRAGRGGWGPALARVAGALDRLVAGATL